MNNYSECRPLMKTGDVLLWRSRSVIGFLIRYFSKAAVNHASLIVSVNEYDRKFQLEAIEQGIALTALSRRLKDFDGKVWWLPLKDELEGYREPIGSIAFSQVGVKYDYESLIAQMFGRVSTDASEFFCSEFVYWCWDKAGIKMNNPSKKAPRPGDIPKLGIFKESTILSWK